MKVLLLSTRSTGGGAPIAVQRLHLALCRNGIESRLLVLHKKEALDGVVEYEPQYKFVIYYWKKLQARFYTWLTKQNRIRRHSISWEKNPYVIHVGNICYHMSLKEIFTTWDYDILHLHWVDGFLDIQDLLYVNKPIVWTLHDCSIFTGGCPHPFQCNGYKMGCEKDNSCPMVGGNWFRYIIKHHLQGKKNVLLHKKICFIAPSHWMERKAEESNLLKQSIIKVIPNCIDTNLFRHFEKALAKELLGLKLNKHYIVYGAYNAIQDKNKGFDLLKEAISNLPPIENIELLVFGATQECGITCSIPVTFIGEVSPNKMPFVYNAAEALIVPSRYENLPSVVIESMACGVSVVAFNIGGISDIVSHLENGYLATAYDINDLSKGIQWVLAHQEHKKKQEMIREINNNFSFEAVARKHIELYKSILVK